MKMIKTIIKIIVLIPRLVLPYKLLDYINIVVIRRLRSFWLYSIFQQCEDSVFFGKIGRITGAECITIGAQTHFGDFFYLTTWPQKGASKPSLKIGEKCNFGAFCHITCANKMIIGNNVLTGKWVTISDNNHGDLSKDSLRQPPCQRQIISKGPVIIEDDVWIGDKVTILSGVHIGRGCVVAANAVVTKNIPAYSVVAGNPARIIK